jgi:hypothetical protein
MSSERQIDTNMTEGHGSKAAMDLNVVHANAAVPAIDIKLKSFC